jgi:hypothetical protein
LCLECDTLIFDYYYDSNLLEVLIVNYKCSAHLLPLSMFTIVVDNLALVEVLELFPLEPFLIGGGYNTTENSIRCVFKLY